MDLKTIVLLMLGGGTVYVAYRNPVLGAAIVAGAAVVTLVYMLLNGGDGDTKKGGGTPKSGA